MHLSFELNNEDYHAFRMVYVAFVLKLNIRCQIKFGIYRDVGDGCVYGGLFVRLGDWVKEIKLKDIIAK